MERFILVAEDDRDVLGLVQDVLEDAGYQVSSAVGGRTVVEASARRPDLILLDYQMPGMDGVSVAEALHSDPQTRSIPIIAMTAAGNASMICRMMDASGCLGKPFDIDELLEVVENLLHKTH
ncbi:MAG TPA: response regulator [Chloroflexota bacterium]|nr:response regulator [Chloroflexota bacterium]